MKELPKGEKVNCEWFLNELERLPSDSAGGVTAEALLRKLPEEARSHAGRCKECAAATEDFADTQKALAGMPESLPEAGPWFTQRVMRAIAVQEEEIEERQNGFWTNVRRLAPRLVAFATLVLMLGGTWAFEERRTTQTNGPQIRSTEGIFESTPATTANDDVISGAHEEQMP